MSRILLIDGEASSRLVLNNRLRDLGHEVVVADSASKGVPLARENPCDMILVDIALTGISGVEVCRRLRQIPQLSATPIILFGKGPVGREEAHQAYDAGADHVLAKAELANLEDVVRALLRTRAQFGELSAANRALDQHNRKLKESSRGADGEGASEGKVLRDSSPGHPDGVLLVDSEGVVTLADRGARDLLGANIQGKNLGRLAPASGLEAFVRDARSEARDGFRLDIALGAGRGVRALTAAVLPLIANPGTKDPGLRVVLLVDAGRRRLSAELARMNEYTIPRREVGVLLDAARLAFGASSLVGSSSAMAHVRGFIHECSATLDPVLIVGEAGSGKTHVARAIHFMSPSGGAFLPHSCAGLSLENLESELFGHVKGAHPEAHMDRPGALQMAQGGSVLLESIELMPRALQDKLEQVLRKGEVVRAGAHRPERVEVRIIATTTVELASEVAAGRFSPELGKLLSAREVRIPPLRERRDDIPLLATQFAQRACSARGDMEVSDAALATLAAHPWNGGVRELETTIERACAEAREGVLDVEHLPLALRDHAVTPPQRDLIPRPRVSTPANPGVISMTTFEPHMVGMGRERPYEAWEISPEEHVSLDLYEKKALLRALKETGGDRLAAARLLKVGKSTLYRKLKRYDIQ
ncbi:MAG TPA: sigma 54-interacting transcriptional regulator [Planctomycetota bacterium]|nr:sigma 54-interacting transcriptional regulator [Planctomycetota bacterium]